MQLTRDLFAIAKFLSCPIVVPYQNLTLAITVRIVALYVYVPVFTSVVSQNKLDWIGLVNQIKSNQINS